MTHPEPGTTAASRATCTATPLTERCRSVLARDEHALLGVSTGNSYFTRQRLAATVGWAAERFAAVDVVYADRHVAAMFEAFGHPPEHARRRADKEVSGVRRRLRGALADVGPAAERVRVSPLSAYRDDAVYREVRGRVRAALRVDVEARVERDRTAYQFLARRLGETGFPSAAQVQAALDYLDAELPFFVDGPRLLRVPSSVTCYHTVLPLARLLHADRVGLRAAANQGYAVVTCPF